MMETRKNAYEAEEKARMKSQDLTIAKKMIINNNAQLDNLERRNKELDTMLSDTVKNSDKMQEELTFWKTKYANDYNEAVRLGDLLSTIGADLFAQMTRLEVMVANGCGTFFFRLQDVELKGRAYMNLPIDLACKTMQDDLCESSKRQNGTNDFPKDEWKANFVLRLAIEAPPPNDETDESLGAVTSELEKLPHIMDQDTHVVDDLGYLEPTTPEKSIPETKLRSDSEETSLVSPTGSSNSEAGHPDSVTSNELEQGSSMCEDSNAESIIIPEIEASSNDEDEGEKLRSVLGYNPNSEEPFYPQYEKASDLPVSNESVEEILELQEPQSPSAATQSLLITFYDSDTGPGVQWLLGYKPEPKEPFYPQY